MDIDWLDFWRELVIANSHTVDSGLVHRYVSHARKRSERPDPLLGFVLQGMDNQTTIVDIGAGTGRWAIPLARVGREVTAVEPSGAMADILRGNLASAGVGNVTIIPCSWEEAIVRPHDIVVCSHAMYASPDFGAFVRKMEQCARKTCYLAIRLPAVDGILGELSLAIYGHRHDSPNAIIAYNALYTMGIYANALVENNIYRWTNTTLEEAFDRAKRHLHLESSDAHDTLIRDTLARRLRLVDNTYIWPDGMRSVLLWWDPATG
ncbi:MAG: class I SAM-dependent methyltransferase [Dehalococcoidales bacterium]|nr:class I SAM-dependent methyltransferase [Dehalococcoidales bacterium]